MKIIYLSHPEKVVTVTDDCGGMKEPMTFPTVTQALLTLGQLEIDYSRNGEVCLYPSALRKLHEEL